MAWQIGDKGFEITLSSYVPDIIGANVRAIVEPLLASLRLTLADIGTWAVHPGGKSIVDKTAEALCLRPEQVAASRHVLRTYGNMSSATMLFVLKELMAGDGDAEAAGRICAMAFGPGLTVECSFLTPVGADAATSP